MTYDVCVIGLGAMGSSAAYQVAKRGQRVLGIEAFTPAHELGSSGGRTRIIRLAYFEHAAYVPMLRAAWAGWHDLEAQTGRELLLETGGLYAGQRGSDVLEGAVRSAEQHDLPHEVLDADETNRRFPAFHLDPGMQAVHEPLAGLLYPDRCIQTHIDLARDNGAELHFEERVTGWTGHGGQGPLHIQTDRGEYDAERLIIAAGAWLPKLVPELDLPLTVERNVAFWFEPGPNRHNLGPDRMPVWILEVDDAHAYYGFPLLPDQGIKVARHHGGQAIDPETISRVATPAEEAHVRHFADRYLPRATSDRRDARVCMYTNTPDQDFIIDTHPDDGRVVICSPCSGHGFKFSNVIGGIAADLVTEGGTAFDIDFLSLNRFALSPLERN